MYGKNCYTLWSWINLRNSAEVCGAKKTKLDNAE